MTAVTREYLQSLRDSPVVILGTGEIFWTNARVTRSLLSENIPDVAIEWAFYHRVDLSWKCFSPFYVIYEAACVFQRPPVPQHDCGCNVNLKTLPRGGQEDFDMKTGESKLKASFTKEISLESGKSSICATKVPMLVHSSPKLTHRPFVYQAKLPKPKATPSNCSNIKNPWVMWSAVVFSAVVVIVVFAALQGKTSGDLKNTRQQVQKLESLIDVLRKNIAELEIR